MRFNTQRNMSKYTLTQIQDNKGQKINEVEGILSLIVDKQCISDEEGMSSLISLLQKNKSKIQGIVIQDFEGAFKVDYLKRIELNLREVKKLRLIIIQNSNLNRDHIQILRNIIWWRRDQLEKIYLNKNSIDSFDFKDLFVSNDFNFTDLKNLKMLDVKVQPGINKLTKNQFNQFANLISKSNVKITTKKQNANSREGLYISLDETSLNNRNRQLLKQSSDTLSSIHLEETNTQRLFYSLNFGGCFSDKNEAGLRNLGEYLIGENFDDITTLSFKKTTLKMQENWIPIFSFLKRTKSILNIDLSSCQLNDKSIINLFTSSFNIKQIDISDNNNIQMNGWIKIFKCLICNQSSVTDSIRIDNCYFQDEEIIKIGEMINSFYKNVRNTNYNCPLRKFYFNKNNQISLQGWESLFGGFFKLTANNLEILELKSCDLDERKLQAIYKAFSSSITSNCALQQLVLRQNPSIGNSQVLCQFVKFIFEKVRDFQKLDISNCQITDQIFTEILKSYSSNDTNLAEIVIKNNPNLGQESYTLLAQHMIFTDKSKIKSIDISGNRLNKNKLQGFISLGQQFQQSAKKNSYLKSFILNQVADLDEETFKELVNLILFDDQCFSLEKVSLQNTLTAEKVKTIQQKLNELQNKQSNLKLKQIYFDRNILSQPEDFLAILTSFFLQSQVCPGLEDLSFSYCNLRYQHLKLLYLKYKSISIKPSNVKKLSFKGNVNISSEGWFVLSHLLFQSGIFKNLQSLDISYCKIDDTIVSPITMSFSQAFQDQPGFKHPLLELTINDNPQLEQYEWQNIMESIIFSKKSQIKTLNAQNCNFDSKSMQMFAENIVKYKAMLEKDGFFENSDRHQLVNFNIAQNDQIDENAWKQFISTYILNKSENVDYEEQMKQKIQIEQADAAYVKEEFYKLEQKYSSKLTEYKIVGKLPVFLIKYLNLKGTGSIDNNQWQDIFQLLIINERSQVEFLGLSQTFIEHKGWMNIVSVINQYIQQHKDLIKLKIIEFNENSYMTLSLWKLAFNKLFFNFQLCKIKALEINNCKITKEILEFFKDVLDPMELQTLKIKRNPQVDSLKGLDNSNFSQIKTIDCETSEIATDQIPPNIIHSLEELTIKLALGSPLAQIQNYCMTLKKLQILRIRGQVSSLDEEFYQIIQYVSQQLETFSMHNQNVKSEDLFPSIVYANTVGTKLKKIDLLGTNIGIQSIEQIRKNKKKINQENATENNNENNQAIEQNTKEKEQEQLKLLKQKWDQILSQGYLDENNKSKNQSLNYLNLSQTIGVSYSGEERDSIATTFILKYAARYCSSLQELHIQNCFMSESAFQDFCSEYQKNKQINLKKLDISNNTQLKTQSWRVFFEKVLFQQKSNFDYLNLSKNLILREEFEILRKLSIKFSSSNFGIKKLHMKELQKSIDASIWIQCFFKDFIQEHRNFEKIFLDDSLSLDSQNAVSEYLKLYVQNSNCKLKCVYGFYEIVQIFKQNNPDRFPVINITKELKENSLFAVIEKWKKGLTSEKIQRIKFNNCLTEEFVNGIPHMNLDFVQDFLEPINQQFNYKLNQKANQVDVDIPAGKTAHILCFDYESIKLMQKYFTDGSQKNESLNPQAVVLNQQVVEYFREPKIFKQIYFIQHRFFDSLDTQQVYELYLKFKDAQIDSIIIDYDLRQVELADYNLSERRLINFIRLFPPKSLELNNVSINALKAIYSIVSSNENFRYANVNFSSQSFINNGIAFSLRESLYMGRKRKNIILKAFDSIAYAFLDIFCGEAGVYKFDETIPILNNNLKTQRFYFNLMIFLAIIYYTILIGCPYFMTKAYGVFVKTKPGVAWQSHYVYAAFAGISFIIEVIIYHYIYKQIRHLLPQLIDVENVDEEDTSFMSKIKRFFKERQSLLEWVSYILQLAFSQIDRFDLYSDVCFIVICFKMEEYVIGFISLVVIANQLLVNIFKLLIYIYVAIVKDKRRVLNTHEINSFCEVSNLVEFEAVNNILDTVAPYNISFVPNNFLFRFLFPTAAGQSISNRLMHSIQKFLLEDVIQIFLQAAFVIDQGKDDLTVMLSIASSILSLLKAFYKFMSIRPTTISQLDFDYLSRIKKNKQTEYNNQLTLYRNNMLQNIQYSVDKYIPNSIIDIKKAENTTAEQKKQAQK
ncbi:transmembrane protein, putative (macronuclear) [Tetrahymena thermophila SB210]|uniref:Transmembrane protein, putative n=1 Tax=Tetrahymena thermophila (strain SB210) TaxID=312017 RepID=Q236M3_TETTS|nr:transmembrane protein, putative [Tetrahymena thermophila SB210]EAR92477.2 transmembrane protein, putative [Tetrahymena thermophila SB210]|eukprot:XP_001012722.2 transmembrane protein, putative [Tetrahymena thermophila SB210]